jgi:protein gp37
MRSLLRERFRYQVQKAAHEFHTGPVVWPPDWPLPNVWLGVSVEDQHWADIRIPALLATPAAVRWISAEPLLGPIDLDRLVCSCGRRRWVDDENWSPEYAGELRRPGAGRIPCGFCNEGGWSELDVDRPGLDWCVVGGESGSGARPMQPDWVRSLRDQCTGAGVPFLVKQWGEHMPLTNGAMARVGKRMAGRRLDGQIWDQYPAAVS